MITQAIDAQRKNSYISSWLDVNSIRVDYFVPQLKGGEIKLAVEHVVYVKLQIGHLNAQCTACVKPH